MAFTDDAVNAKLSALNETQEGIVTVAQWILFHRRHADRAAHLWMQRLKDSNAPKRLNLIYLANEVVQQSKARRKNDFVEAFSPIIAESTGIAYKSATHDVQQKLRRVIEVWRQRAIFDPSVQDSIEKHVNELDKNRATGGAGRKPALGGSLFSSSSAPPEIQPLVPLQTALNKAQSTQKPAVTTAYNAYDALIDPGAPVPTPPVHAARLSAVLKNLASAEGAVAESIKARRELISGLEKLLETNRTALAADESAHFELGTRRAGIEAKKREVEDGIMRGLSAEASSSTPPVPVSLPLPGDPRRSGAAGVEEPAQPEAEPLTPPPVESLTPVGSPRAVANDLASLPSHVTAQPNLEALEATIKNLVPQTRQRSEEAVDMNGYLAQPNNAAAIPTDGVGFDVQSAKRRRVEQKQDDDGEFPGAAGDAYEGIDADVAAMLGSGVQ